METEKSKNFQGFILQADHFCIDIFLTTPRAGGAGWDGRAALRVTYVSIQFRDIYTYNFLVSVTPEYFKVAKHQKHIFFL
jgi:hypothetical protein